MTEVDLFSGIETAWNGDATVVAAFPGGIHRERAERPRAGGLQMPYCIINDLGGSGFLITSTTLRTGVSIRFNVYTKEGVTDCDRLRTVVDTWAKRRTIGTSDSFIKTGRGSSVTGEAITTGFVDYRVTISDDF